MLTVITDAASDLDNATNNIITDNSITNEIKKITGATQDPVKMKVSNDDLALIPALIPPLVENLDGDLTKTFSNEAESPTEVNEAASDGSDATEGNSNEEKVAQSVSFMQIESSTKEEPAEKEDVKPEADADKGENADD
jgi:hypothetical protein